MLIDFLLQSINICCKQIIKGSLFMEDKKKISFRQKKFTVCPVCSFEFYREELFSGGGRLIAAS
jgi:hypothetical protein